MRRSSGQGSVRANGYIVVGALGHPLAGKSGKTYLHRLVLWDKIGPGWHACHACRTMVAWGSAKWPLWVDHMSWDKADNSPENLEPSCASCNSRRWKDRDDRGARSPVAKLTKSDVLAIRASSDRQVDLAARYGVDQSHISAIKRGARWGAL